MSKYITHADIVDRIGAQDFTWLCDRDNDGMPDVAVYTAAISAAESVIDSYLGNRTALPLDGIVSDDDPSLNTVPRVLVNHAVSISIYEMARLDAGRNTEARRQDYDDAMQWLRDYSSGKVALGVAKVDVPAPLNGGVVRIGGPRTYSVAQLDKLL